MKTRFTVASLVLACLAACPTHAAMVYEETGVVNGIGYGTITDGTWTVNATRVAKDSQNLAMTKLSYTAEVVAPAPLDFTTVKDSGGNDFFVTKLGAFTGRYSSDTNLTELVAPHCTAIGSSWAFHSCLSLTNVVLGAGFASSYERAFDLCSKLARFQPRCLNLPQVYAGFFNGCTKLAGEFEFPLATSINVFAFYKTCVERVVATNATSVGESTFEGCTNLLDVVLSPVFEKINWQSFKGCTRLAPDTLGRMLGESVQEIGKGRYSGLAFYGCTSLAGTLNWDFPNLGTNVVRESSFFGCSSLEGVVFKTPLAEVRSMAFSGCSSLRSAVFLAPANVIDNSAFYGIAPGAEVHMHSRAPDMYGPAAVARSVDNPPYPKVYLKDNVEGWFEAMRKYNYVIGREDFGNNEWMGTVTNKYGTGSLCAHTTRSWLNMATQMAKDTTLCESETTGGKVSKVTVRDKRVIAFMLRHSTDNHSEHGCWICREPQAGLHIFIR